MIKISREITWLVETVRDIVGTNGYVEGPFTVKYTFGLEERLNVLSPSLRPQTGYPDIQGVPEFWAVHLIWGDSPRAYLSSTIYGDSRLGDFIRKERRRSKKEGRRLEVISENTQTVKIDGKHYRLVEPGEDIFTANLKHGNIRKPEIVTNSLRDVWDIFLTLYEPAKMTIGEVEKARVVAELVSALSKYPDIWTSSRSDLRRLHSVPLELLPRELRKLAEMGDVIGYKAKESLRRIEMVRDPNSETRRSRETI